MRAHTLICNCILLILQWILIVENLKKKKQQQKTQLIKYSLSCLTHWRREFFLKADSESFSLAWPHRPPAGTTHQSSTHLHGSQFGVDGRPVPGDVFQGSQLLLCLLQAPLGVLQGLIEGGVVLNSLLAQLHSGLRKSNAKPKMNDKLPDAETIFEILFAVPTALYSQTSQSLPASSVVEWLRHLH